MYIHLNCCGAQDETETEEIYAGQVIIDLVAAVPLLQQQQQQQQEQQEQEQEQQQQQQPLQQQQQQQQQQVEELLHRLQQGAAVYAASINFRGFNIAADF